MWSPIAAPGRGTLFEAVENIPNGMFLIENGEVSATGTKEDIDIVETWDLQRRETLQGRNSKERRLSFDPLV